MIRQVLFFWDTPRVVSSVPSVEMVSAQGVVERSSEARRKHLRLLRTPQDALKTGNLYELRASAPERSYPFAFERRRPEFILPTLRAFFYRALQVQGNASRGRERHSACERCTSMLKRTGTTYSTRD